MKVLIVGGAGFIGSHIADAHLERGDEVVILDNLSTGERSNLPAAAEFVEGDITDKAFVEELIGSREFEAINHHAAQLDVRVSVADPALDARQNIIGSIHLLQAAAEAGVKRFLFASSGGTVYGEPQEIPTPESHPTEPISPYGVAKLSVEKYMGYYSHQYGIHVGALRYTNIYGPRQSSRGEAGVVAIFSDRMLRGENPIINGDGTQTRDYVFVADVVRANLALIDYLEDHQSGIFNISTATEFSVVDLFNHLAEIIDGEFREVHGPAKPGEQERSCCTYRLAERELGWIPATGIEEGLRQTVEYFRGRS